MIFECNGYFNGQKIFKSLCEYVFAYFPHKIHVIYFPNPKAFSKNNIFLLLKEFYV